MKLVQKQFLKGRREYEIVDDVVLVRIKSLFKEEKLSVDISTLDPEPVIKGAEAVFYSRFKGRPVLSLLLNKPNTKKYNDFVATLKQGVTGKDESPKHVETSANATYAEALNHNVYDEPPDFDAEPIQQDSSFQPINVGRLENDIRMLKLYLNENDIGSFLDVLETLKAEPGNETAFKNMLDAFKGLGIYQGAILTYAPYLKALFSNAGWSALNR